MSRIGKKPIPSPPASRSRSTPGSVTVKGPKGELSERIDPDITVAQDDGAADRHAADRPRAAPCAARPDPLAGRQHGHGRHRGLREAARDPGRRLPRSAQGAGSRDAARLQPPGQRQGARRDQLRGARSRPRSSSGASPSSASARSPPRSASGGRRSRTRARASATRASTSSARSEASSERGIKTKEQARLRRHRRVRSKITGTAERPRLAVYRSNARIYAQLIDDARGHTLAAASSLDKDVAGAEARRAGRAGRQADRRAGQGGRRRAWSSSTAAATSTTAGSRRWPTPPARAGLEF